MKKGFTLIELLAVIVILAIIALIATPIVLNIIDEAKQSSTLRSVDNILKGAELYVSKGLMNSENLSGNIYEDIMKTIDGGKPDSGNIYTNRKGEIAFSFKYDNYCYTKGYEDSKVKKEKTDVCKAPIDYIGIWNQDNDASKPAFGSNIAKSEVEKIYTKATNKVPSGVIGSFDVSEAQNGSIIAWYKDEDSNGLYELYIGQEGGVKANPDSSKLFNYFINVEEIDLSNFDTSNVTDMTAMFQQCQSLPTLDLSGFNTSNVISMRNLFYNCRCLTSLDLSSFDTSNVTTFRSMFNRCIIITKLDLSNFDTSNVTDMRGMFSDSHNLTSLDVSSFDTSNVTDMHNMFAVIKYITSLDLSNFDTSNVIDVSSMFYETNALQTIKLNKASFEKVTIYSDMFTNTGVTNIIVEDDVAKSFIEARLTEAGKNATVTSPS